jgi:hypothetical protein
MNLRFLIAVPLIFEPDLCALIVTLASGAGAMRIPSRTSSPWNTGLLDK